MKETLITKFINLTKGHDLFTPVPNIPLFSPWIIGHIAKGYYNDTFPAPYLVLMKEGEESTLFMSEMKFKNVAKEAFVKYWNSTEFLGDNKKDADKFIAEIDRLYEKSTIEYVGTADEKDVLSLASDALETNKNLNTRIWFTIYFDKDLAQKMLKDFGSQISDERFEEIWPKAEDPTLGSFEKSRNLHIMKLISEGSGWNFIAEQCQYFYANYPGVDSIEESLKKTKEEYGSVSVEDATLSLKKDAEDEQEKVRLYNEWFSALSVEEKKFVTYTQEIIRVRDARKNAVSKTLTILHRVTQRLFKDAELSESLFKYYSSSEVALGSKHLIDNKEEFLRRKEGVVMMYLVDQDNDPEIELIDYAECKTTLLDHYNASVAKKIEESATQIKGQVACAGGIIQGTVRIVFDPKSTEEFGENDILVTSMTRPEFVPLMKKSIAIITNEGGIASHAAIVSRELKIPCITGTKIATKVLKSGDFVEVNAKTGMITVLKSA